MESEARCHGKKINKSKGTASRAPGNNNETPFMHAWIPPLPPPRPAGIGQRHIYRNYHPRVDATRRDVSLLLRASSFAFTCCYSKISCLNRHLGSTLLHCYPPFTSIRHRTPSSSSSFSYSFIQSCLLFQSSYI